MAWLFLLIAGGFEVFWATFMKLSDGFSHLGYSILTVFGMLISFFFLSQAIKTLPMGTAYAVWTGIGALGSFLVGIFLFHEPASLSRMLFASLLFLGVIGLKMSA